MARLFLILIVAALAARAHAQASLPAQDQAAVTAQEAQPLGMPASQRSNPGADTTSATGSMATTAASLAAVIALMFVCFAGYKWIAGRAGGLVSQVNAVGAPAGVLDLLGRYPLGRGQTLLLLKVDRRILLVAQSVGSRVGSPPAMSTLCEIADPDEVSAILGRINKPDTSFNDVIARFEHPGAPAPQSGNVEVVDLTRSRGAFSKLVSFGGRQA